MWRYGRTPGRDVSPLTAGQLVGSVLGAAAGRLVWGPAIADYALIRPAPGWSWTLVAVVEATTMFVIVATAGIGISSPRLAPFTPWAVGTLIATQIIAFGTLTGGIANPAREFVAAVLADAPSLLPAYLLAPPVGALAATVTIRRLNTCRRTG